MYQGDIEKDARGLVRALMEVNRLPNMYTRVRWAEKVLDYYDRPTCPEDTERFLGCVVSGFVECRRVELGDTVSNLALHVMITGGEK